MSEQQAPTYSRRALLRAALGGAGAAALAACGGDVAPPATSVPAQSTGLPTAGAPTAAGTAGAGTATAGRAAAATPVAVEGKIPGGAPGVPDAYTRRPPVFRSVQGVPGRGGTVSTFQNIATPPPTPKAENRYWQELERRLGATLEPSFVPTSAVPERLAAVIAADTPPDLVWLHLKVTPDQHRVIQQGGYTDLTPHLTGDALKDYPNLAAFPDYLWQNVRINGKIYGVPTGTLLVNEVFFYRRDWGERVGIARPRNAEELLQMALAFTRQDPDGNGAADTWGLGSLAGGERVRTDIFEQMFRVPNNWRRNPDGSLTNAVETEEFKGAIAFMRRCWEAGAYHPDALTLTNRQVQDLAYASRLGAYAGGLGALGNHRRQTRQQTPTADVRPLLPSGHDGGAGVTHKDGGFTNFTAISARAGRDRERARELLRVLDWYSAPFGSEEQVFKNNGLEGVHHTVGPNGALEPTEAGRLQISGFPNLASHPLVFFDPDSPDEAPLLQGATAEMVRLGIDDPTQGLYSPAQAARAGQLDRLQDDRLVAIVAGREPLGALDGFVRDWKSRGGDEIRKELEEALREQR